MKLEEIQDCVGFSVQVSVNGVDAIAEIETRFSANGLPHLSCPPPLDGSFGDVDLLPITQEIAEKMRLTGGRNFFSTIQLTKDGAGKHRYA